MINLTQYLLESSICLALFYSFYHVLLRRETFFQLNRFYLLLTPALSLSIPVLNISLREAQPTHYFYPIVAQADTWNQRLWETMETQPTPLFTFTFGDLLLMLYGIGVFIMAQKLFQSLWRVGQIIRRSRHIAIEDFTVVETESDLPAASFFSFVFWKGGQLSERQRLILEHELVHVRQKHSLDVLLMELWVILKWFNPLIYLFRRSLRITHEYIADCYVAQKSGLKSTYAQLLVQQGQANSCLPLVNTFSFLTKKRLLMLSRRPSSNWRYAKYLLSLPLLLMLLVLFSFNLTDNLPDGVKAPFQDAATALDELSRKELISIKNQQTLGMKDFEYFTPYPDSTDFILNGKLLKASSTPVAIFEEDVLDFKSFPASNGKNARIEITTKNQYQNVQPLQVVWGDIQFTVPEKTKKSVETKLLVYKKTQQYTVSEAMIRTALQQQPKATFSNGQPIAHLDYDLMHIPTEGKLQWNNRPDMAFLKKISQQLQPNDVLELRKFLPENIGIHIFLEVRSDKDYEIREDKPFNFAFQIVENQSKIDSQNDTKQKESIGDTTILKSGGNDFSFQMTAEEFKSKMLTDALFVEHWGRQKKVEQVEHFVRVPRRNDVTEVHFPNKTISAKEREGAYGKLVNQAQAGDSYYLEGVKLEGESETVSLAFNIMEEKKTSKNLSDTTHSITADSYIQAFRLTSEEFKAQLLGKTIKAKSKTEEIPVEDVSILWYKSGQETAEKLYFNDYAQDVRGDRYNNLIRQAKPGDTYVFENVSIAGTSRNEKPMFIYYIVDKQEPEKLLYIQSQNDHISILPDKQGAPVPFYILDGEIIDSEALKLLKPDNISSIQVLKDQDAIKLYGEKAKNGVIIITTKTKAQ